MYEVIFLKYLHQILLIFLFSFLGELLRSLIPLPIPASIYGMILLFGALFLKIVPAKAVKDMGGFLTSILALLFVSPAVGIVEDWALIREDLLAILILLVASTVLTFGIAGRTAQAFLKKGGDSNG